MIGNPIARSASADCDSVPLSGKVLERQVRGQLNPINDHFQKLGSPNEPGGNDPRNRDKWKNDIRRAIDRIKDKVEKMSGKQRQKWEEVIRQNEDKLRNVE